MCEKALRSDLNPTAATGGVWTYLGYNPSDPTVGSWGFTPPLPLVPFTIGQTMPGDDPTVDSAGASDGFYRFGYTTTNGGCTSTTIVMVQVKTSTCAGDDFSLALCSNSPSFSLATLFDTQSACDVNIGTLTNPSANSTYGGFPNYTFNPAVNPVGVHVIRNTVQSNPYSGFAIDCPDCINSADATLTIIAFKSSGDEQFVPYLSICTDPTCSVSLPSLILNLPINSTDGNWYLRPAETGFPTYTNAQLLVNTNLYPNVDHFWFTDTQLTNATVLGTIGFANAEPGYAYNFEYVVNENTPCEDRLYVQIYVGPIPNSGTPPATETLCYQNIPDLTMNLFDQLSGGPSSQGVWTITSSPSRPNRINECHIEGNEDPLFLFNGADNIFDFQQFRNTATNDGGGGPVQQGTSFTFTFNYTAQLPTTYLCANCAPDTTTYTKTIIFTYNPGSTIYNTPAAALVVNQTLGTINLFDTLTGFEEGGVWRVAPTSLAPTSITIPNLTTILGTSNYSPSQQLTFNGAVYDGGYVDITNVTPGTYAVLYQGGQFPSGGETCPRNTVVYIKVEAPVPACTVDVNLNLS